jgi:hypothetical protein
MASLEKLFERTLAAVNGLSSYWFFDKAECDRVLRLFGWKPVNLSRPKFKFAREIHAIYNSGVQVYYNASTKAKVAFLGYHKVDQVTKNGTYPVDELWLRVIGDNELKKY